MLRSSRSRCSAGSGGVGDDQAAEDGTEMDGPRCSSASSGASSGGDAFTRGGKSGGLQQRRLKTICNAPLLPRPRSLGAAACNTLYGGALFSGSQSSDDRSYSVKVLVKHVDWDTSFLCGDLTIDNLTAQFPTMTTFFEAEIIGDRYSFLTSKWDADEHVDFEHWKSFPSFCADGLDRLWKDPDFVYDFRNSDNIYMRWKEHFLVHDHTIRNVKGASFAGFYYICVSRSRGNIEGFYYHVGSEWFQALKLSIVEETSFQSFDFR